MFLLLLLALFSVSAVQASDAPQVFVPQGIYKTALPPNTLYQYDRITRRSRISEASFNQIIANVETIMAPVAKAHGAEFKFVRHWTDPTVNAYANQTNGGKTWEVHMFGGLARRPEITEDGFALVVCHEVGHHVAGFAFYDNKDWASSEGQSDYFSTQACARLLWGPQSRFNQGLRRVTPDNVQQRCAAVWKNGVGTDLCGRSVMAGQSLANLLATLGGTPAPQVETPDTATVSTTDVAHPKAQCRLDTYMAGALCTKRFDLNIIPGAGAPEGQLSAKAETATIATSCTTAEGYNEGMLVQIKIEVKPKTDSKQNPGGSCHSGFFLIYKASTCSSRAREVAQGKCSSNSNTLGLAVLPVKQRRTGCIKSPNFTPQLSDASLNAASHSEWLGALCNFFSTSPTAALVFSFSSALVFHFKTLGSTFNVPASINGANCSAISFKRFTLG